MHTETFWVGELECLVLVHARGRGSPSWMFPDVPEERLAQRMGRYLDGIGRFAYVSASLMIRVGRDIALLDTGHSARAAGEPSSIERHLAAIGVRPSEIGTVLISHGHLDHIGGLVGSHGPVFDRARHFIDGRELEYWTSGEHATGDAASLLRPVVDAGLVDEVGGEQEVLPGVKLLPTPGHTPGHVAVAITSRDEAALYVGDVLAHEVNVPEPGWNHFSDMFPGPAARSRQGLVEWAARHRALAVGSHLTTRGRVTTSPTDGFVYAAEVPGGRPPAV